MIKTITRGEAERRGIRTVSPRTALRILLIEIAVIVALCPVAVLLGVLTR